MPSILESATWPQLRAASPKPDTIQTHSATELRNHSPAQSTEENESTQTENPDERHSKRDQASRFQITKTQIMVNIAAVIFLSVVIVLVQSTYSAQATSGRKAPLTPLMKINVSTTLTVVRAAQGILSGLMTVALQESFSYLQWAGVGKPCGISYSDFLAMSPTTGFTGVVSIMWSSSVKMSSKIWALSRVSLFGLLWISGLTLFFNTTLVTVYDSRHRYDVTAGVGPFNGSLVQPFMKYIHSLAPDYPYNVLPYTYHAAVYALVANPLVSTLIETPGCQKSNCISYLLNGGLSMVAPWLPAGYDDYSMVKIDNVISVQLEFTKTKDTHFKEADCDIYGGAGTVIGIRVCVAPSRRGPGSLRAGLFVCANGTDQGACSTGRSFPNLTTTATFYTRQATVIVSPSNYSIVSVDNISPPEKLGTIDIPAYRMALGWLLNFTAADIPPPSSIAQSFWSSQQQLKNPATYGILSQNFQSILSFPIWFFNSNNWGNTELRSNKIINSLPPEFYTEASLVTPYTKLRFNLAMFIIYAVLQGILIAFTIGILILIWLGHLAPLQTSSFPLHDAVARAHVRSHTLYPAGEKTDNLEVLAAIKGAFILRRDKGQDSEHK